MAEDYGRLVASHNLDFERFELAPIEHTPVAEVARRAAACLAVAEVVLAADVEREIGGQPAAVRLEKIDQTAEVVEVPVTEDQRLCFRRIDADHFHVAEVSLGRVAVVEQQIASVGA